MPEQRKYGAALVVAIMMSQYHHELVKNSGAYRLVSLILNEFCVTVTKISATI